MKIQESGEGLAVQTSYAIATVA